MRPDDDDERTDIYDILFQVMPELGRLAGIMVSSKIALEEERKRAIEDLYSLVSKDCSVIYRPRENPIHGRYPAKDCDTEMAR